MFSSNLSAEVAKTDDKKSDFKTEQTAEFGSQTDERFRKHKSTTMHDEGMPFFRSSMNNPSFSSGIQTPNLEMNTVLLFI